MNIVIFGGGAPGRLGNLLGTKAQREGHKVISISHCAYPNSELEIVVTDFNSADSVVNAFEQILQRLGSVDLVFYCSRNPHNSRVDINLFDPSIVSECQTSLLIDVTIPHRLLTVAQQHSQPCHFAFFTTQFALEFGQEENRNFSTYIGGKAWQLHLVRALVKNNTKVTATMFSIHFDWDGSPKEKEKFEYLYNLVLYYRNNGTIVNAHSPINIVSL